MTKILLAIGVILVVGAAGIAVYKMQSTKEGCDQPTKACCPSETQPVATPAQPVATPQQPVATPQQPVATPQQPVTTTQPVTTETSKTPVFRMKIEYCTS